MAYEDIVRTIAPSSNAWTPGTAFQYNPEWTPLLAVYVYNLSKAGSAIGSAYIALTVCLLLVLVIFLPTSFVYIKMLYRQSQSYNIRKAFSPNVAAASNEQKRISKLKLTYRLMMLETLIVVVVSSTLREDYSN